jgi:hypothetical protein
MGESWAGDGKLLLDVLSQTGCHGAHANRKGKSAEPYHWGVLSAKSQFAKSAGKRGMINILGKLLDLTHNPTNMPTTLILSNTISPPIIAGLTQFKCVNALPTHQQTLFQL